MWTEISSQEAVPLNQAREGPSDTAKEEKATLHSCTRAGLKAPRPLGAAGRCLRGVRQNQAWWRGKVRPSRQSVASFWGHEPSGCYPVSKPYEDPESEEKGYKGWV